MYANCERTTLRHTRGLFSVIKLAMLTIHTVLLVSGSAVLGTFLVILVVKYWRSSVVYDHSVVYDQIPDVVKSKKEDDV